MMPPEKATLHGLLERVRTVRLHNVERRRIPQPRGFLATVHTVHGPFMNGVHGENADRSHRSPLLKGERLNGCCEGSGEELATGSCADSQSKRKEDRHD